MHKIFTHIKNRTRRTLECLFDCENAKLPTCNKLLYRVRLLWFSFCLLRTTGKQS